MEQARICIDKIHKYMHFKHLLQINTSIVTSGAVTGGGLHRQKEGVGLAEMLTTMV